MAGEPVELLFGVHVDRGALIDMIIALGGGPPDSWDEAMLTRDSRRVWVDLDPQDPAEPDQAVLAEKRLGGPVGTRVMITLSRAEGSDRVALEVIEAAAKRWPLIVDTLDRYLPTLETLVTAEELRARADAGKPYLVNEEVPPGVSVTEMLLRRRAEEEQHNPPKRGPIGQTMAPPIPNQHNRKRVTAIRGR